MREEYDFYKTPKEDIEKILGYIDLGVYGDRVLEPGAGDGGICEVIRNRYREKWIVGVEIREGERERLERVCDEVVIGDFLELSESLGKFDIIIGNPPYKYAMEFVDRSLQILGDGGVLIFLLRTAFLESKARYEFWQKNPVSRLYVLSSRPKFVNGKTDSCSYSWFVWEKGKGTGDIVVI